MHYVVLKWLVFVTGVQGSCGTNIYKSTMKGNVSPCDYVYIVFSAMVVITNYHNTKSYLTHKSYIIPHVYHMLVSCHNMNSLSNVVRIVMPRVMTIFDVL